MSIADPRRLVERVCLWFALLGCCSSAPIALCQASSAPGTDKQVPTFTPSGVQGTVAPSGYSAAASAEETSQVMHRAAGQETIDASLFHIAGTIPDCAQETHLLAGLRENPQSSEINHSLGLFYLYHQDFSRSIHYLQESSRLGKTGHDSSRDLALAYLGAKQYGSVIALLRQAPGEEKLDALSLRILAAAYYATGNTTQSIAEYRRAGGVDSSEETQFAVGMALMRIGATAEAAEVFHQATAAYPSWARSWMGLGVVQTLQDRKADAARSLLHATDLDPDYLPSYSFLAGLFGSVPAVDAEIRRKLEVLVVSHSESAEAHFDYARALWKQKLLEPAGTQSAEIEAQLKLAIEKDPDEADTHLLLGEVYADAGAYPKAIEEFKQAIRLDPDDSHPHYRLAQAYRRNGQPTLADEELGKFKALSSGKNEGRELPGASEAITKPAPCNKTEP